MSEEKKLYVIGAGTVEVNGIYSAAGERGGCTKWIRKEGDRTYQICRSKDKFWIFRSDRNGIEKDIDFYNSKEKKWGEAEIPPADPGTYKPIKGALPCPRFLESYEVVISDAGSKEVVGLYEPNGESGGAPQFIRHDKKNDRTFKIRRCTGSTSKKVSWWIYRSDRNGISKDIDYYNVYSESDLPPLTGWKKLRAGALPLPNFSTCSDIQIVSAGSEEVLGRYEVSENKRDNTVQLTRRDGDKEYTICRSRSAKTGICKWWICRTDRNGIESDIDFYNIECEADLPPFSGYTVLRKGEGPPCILTTIENFDAEQNAEAEAKDIATENKEGGAIYIIGAGSEETCGRYTKMDKMRDGVPQFSMSRDTKEYTICRATGSRSRKTKWWICRTDRNGIKEDIDFYNKTDDSDSPPGLGFETLRKGSNEPPEISLDGSLYMLGAGESEANGRYMATHFSDGVTVFERISSGGTTFRIERVQIENQDSKVWQLTCMDSKKGKVVLYQSLSDADTPPRHGWEYDEEILPGKSPVPDVSVRCNVNVEAGFDDADGLYKVEDSETMPYVLKQQDGKCVIKRVSANTWVLQSGEEEIYRSKAWPYDFPPFEHTMWSGDEDHGVLQLYTGTKPEAVVIDKAVEEISKELGDLLKKRFIHKNEYREVVEKLEKSGTKYVDEEFVPSKKSICSEKAAATKRTREKLQAKNIEWRRPSEFLREGVLYDGTDANDISQGSLGDCWALSSIAALAENDDLNLVERMFLDKKANNAGIYGIHICIDGLWRTILIDDYLPCHPRGGPIFAKSLHNEFWGCLLEKAYAKVFGGYGNLAGGHEAHAMLDFTGYPSMYIPLGKCNEGKVDKERTFQNLLLFTKLGYSMTCGTPGESTWEKIGIDPQTAKKKAGVCYGHAYTLLGAREEEVDGKKLRLLHVRNPWGSGEWKGNYSDNDREGWTPEALEKFKPVFANDGAFYIPYDEWWKYYNEVSVLLSTSLDGNKWKSPKRYSIKSDKTWKLSIKPIEVTKECQICLAAFQPDKRNPKNPQEYARIRVHLFDENLNCVSASAKSWDASKRQVIAIAEKVEPGQYVVVLSCEINPDKITISECGVSELNGTYTPKPRYHMTFEKKGGATFKNLHYGDGTRRTSINVGDDNHFHGKDYIAGGFNTEWKGVAAEPKIEYDITERAFTYVIYCNEEDALETSDSDYDLKKIDKHVAAARKDYVEKCKLMLTTDNV